MGGMSGLRIQYNTDIRTPTGPDDPTCYNANGLPILDEFVADDAMVHFEAMDTAGWWIGIRLKDGRYFHLRFGVDYDQADEAGRARPYAYLDEWPAESSE